MSSLNTKVVAGWITRLTRGLGEMLFPAQCLGCGESDEGEPICSACAAQLPLIKEPYCIRCGRPAAGSVTAEGPLPCGECRLHAPPFVAARSVYRYSGLVADALKALKYHGRLRLAARLAQMASERLKGDPMGLPLEEIEVVAPVPLHADRARWRGYNHSELMAAQLASSLGTSMLPGLLVRKVDTPPQVMLGGKARRENVRGAFAAPRRHQVEGKTILLFDDVYTTGATLRECSRVLKRARAKAVFCLTIARQLPGASDIPTLARRTKRVHPDRKDAD